MARDQECCGCHADGKGDKVSDVISCFVEEPHHDVSQHEPEHREHTHDWLRDVRKIDDDVEGKGRQRPYHHGIASAPHQARRHKARDEECGPNARDEAQQRKARGAVTALNARTDGEHQRAVCNEMHRRAVRKDVREPSPAVVAHIGQPHGADADEVRA